MPTFKSRACKFVNELSAIKSEYNTGPYWAETTTKKKTQLDQPSNETIEKRHFRRSQEIFAEFAIKNEAGGMLDNSYFDNSFDLFRQFKN